MDGERARSASGYVFFPKNGLGEAAIRGGAPKIFVEFFKSRETTPEIATNGILESAENNYKAVSYVILFEQKIST